MGDININEMSKEDLCFEVKRLAQKIQVLENDKIIMQEEFAIAHTVQAAHPSGDNTAQLRTELANARSLLTMCVTKYKVVKSFLDLERKTLAEVKMELDNTSSRMLKELDVKMGIFRDTVLAREAVLQHRYQRASRDLYRDREAVERLKLELHESRGERRLLHRSIDDLSAEMTIEKNKCKTQFESMSSKIENYQKQHAEEVKRLHDHAANKEREREQLVDELARWKLTLKQRVDEKLAVDKKLEDLAALGRLEAARAAESLQAEQRESSALRGSMAALQAQQEKLLNTHNSMQSDFKSVLAREMSLRAELSGSSSDQGEMQRRLRSITDKVATLESEHAQELGAQQDRAQQLQRLLDSALEGREREGARAHTLAAEVTRLENLVQLGAGRAEGLAAEVRQAHAAQKVSEGKVLQLQTDQVELRHALECIRGDRDDALNQSSKFQSEMKAMHKKLLEAEMELKDLVERKSSDAGTLAEVSRLKSELEMCERKREEQRAEVLGLKDTVRRECEERTELVIEASELRDRLKRLQQQQQQQRGGGGALRSQSGGGVDSSVQAARQQQLEDAGQRPSMLRQLTSSDSALPLPSGALPQGSTEREDHQWSKQRQAAQQHGGKPRRVSKYRP